MIAPARLPTVYDLVRAERRHQQARGFTAAHDQQHNLGELVDAAVSHLAAAQDNDVEARLQWPWARPEAPVSGNRQRHLLVAIALLFAEMERHAPHLREEVRP